ncbi:hypothetical protein EVAR_222_1 [Eumeta japonica]|uniref:KASH domain-containing protein n=1 Tax=Eumeta variegata TaxID=151549 RepID=A0A4C1S8Z7_EUMVA|nr:hypothetical protein EVAR_222_1 [Eumeta japonica]
MPEEESLQMQMQKSTPETYRPHIEKNIFSGEPEIEKADIASFTKNLIESEIQHAILVSPVLDISIMAVDKQHENQRKQETEDNVPKEPVEHIATSTKDVKSPTPLICQLSSPKGKVENISDNQKTIAREDEGDLPKLSSGEKHLFDDGKNIIPECIVETDLKINLESEITEPTLINLKRIEKSFEDETKIDTNVPEKNLPITDKEILTVIEETRQTLSPEVIMASETQKDNLQSVIVHHEEMLEHEESVKAPVTDSSQVFKKEDEKSIEDNSELPIRKSVIEETQNFLLNENRAPELVTLKAPNEEVPTEEDRADQNKEFMESKIEENSTTILCKEILQETSTQSKPPLVDESIIGLDDKKESQLFVDTPISTESIREESVEKGTVIQKPVVVEDDKKIIEANDLSETQVQQNLTEKYSSIEDNTKEPEIFIESPETTDLSHTKIELQEIKNQTNIQEESFNLLSPSRSADIPQNLTEVTVSDVKVLGNILPKKLSEIHDIQQFITAERLNTEIQENKQTLENQTTLEIPTNTFNPETTTQMDVLREDVPRKTIDIAMSLTKLDHKIVESTEPHVRVDLKVEDFETEKPKMVKKDIDVDLPVEIKITSKEKLKLPDVVEKERSQTDESLSESPSNKEHKRNKKKKKHKDDNIDFIQNEMSSEPDKSVLETESSSLSHYVELPVSPTTDSPKPTITSIEYPITVTDESPIETEHIIEEIGYEPEDFSIEKSLTEDKSKKKRKKKHQISEETTYPKQSTTESDETVVSTPVEVTEQTEEKRKDKKKKDKKKQKHDTGKLEEMVSPKLGNEVIESPQKDESYHTISETSDVNTVKVVEECVHSSPESIPKDNIHSTVAYTVPVVEGISIYEQSVQTSPEASISHTEEIAKYEVVVPETADFSLQTSPLQQSEIPVQTSPMEDREVFTQTCEEIGAIETTPKISDIVTTIDMIVQTSRAETPEQVEKSEATTQVIPHEVSFVNERYSQTSPSNDGDIIKTEIITESRELQTSPIELAKEEKGTEVTIDTKEIDIQTYGETSERETLTSPLKTTEVIEASIQTPERQLTSTSTQSEIKEPLFQEHIKYEKPEIKEQEVQVSDVHKLDNTQQTTPRGIFSEDSTSTDEPYELHLRAQVSIPQVTNDFLNNERSIQRGNEPEERDDLNKEKNKSKKSRKHKRKIEEKSQAQSPESLSDPITTELSISVTPTSDDQSSKEVSSIDEGIYQQFTSFPIKYKEDSITQPKLSYSDVVQRSKSKSPSPSDKDLLISRKPDNVRLKEVLEKRTLSVSEPQQNSSDNTLCLALLEPTVEQSYELIVNNEIDEVKKAIETRDNIRIEKSIIVVIETISIWLEEVQYKIYTKCKDSSPKQSDDSERFLIFKNYIENLKKIAEDTETNPEITVLLDSLNKQMLAVTTLSSQSSSKAEENEGEWNKFLQDIDLLCRSVDRVKISLDDLLISDMPTQHKLENLDKIEINNNENADKISQLYRRFRNFIKINSERECPIALFSVDDDIKQTENSINTERDRLLQLSALAEEYEQTLQDFAQITDIAEALATSIVDRAASRAQQMTLAASRWTTLEQGMKEEQQWLRVAQQRVPDLTNVTSIDHEQYINLYQSIILDVSHHHAKMLRLLSITESLQNLIVCSGIDTECSTALDTLLKLHEDIDSRLTRLTAFKENWLTYDHLIDRIESWMKTANREILQITPENVTTTGNLRKFWELKAQHEVYNNLKNESGVQFEKALEILPISDEMVQRQFFSKIEDEWQHLSSRIDNVHKTAIQNISDRDVSSGEKLNILEEEIKELRCSLEGLKGVIKSEDELNLYIERLQVMTSRIDRIQNELGRLSLLPTAESERLGALLSQSRILDDQIAEELERSLLLKEKIVQVQSGIARCQKNQRRARLTLEECEAAERLGSDVVERAADTCNALMKDLSTQWQDILTLRQALHTLPTSLRVCVSPTGVERDISALQESHAQLEDACNDLCQRLRARVQLWRRFERQLEQVQGAVREADYMVELLTVQGQTLSESLSRRSGELVGELRQAAAPLEGSTEPSVAAQLRKELDDAATAYEHTCCNLTQLCDKYVSWIRAHSFIPEYHRAVDLWKRYRDAAAAVRAFAEFQEGRLHALRPHDAPDAAKVTFTPFSMRLII